MTAIGQNLPLKLGFEAFGRRFDVTRLAGDAKRRIAERDHSL